MKKTVVLIVLDGWGIGPQDQANPIHIVNPKNIAYIKENFPSASLQASGIAVGLPWGEEGNSEVGHLTMGIGKIVYQHYPRITLAIKDGSFQKNPAIRAALDHAKEHKSKLHLVGLIGEGNIHSSLEHLGTLIDMAKEAGVPYVLDAITDGRDSAPRSASELLSRFEKSRIGSVMGRFYAMDRDRHWDFTKQAYQALTGISTGITPEEIDAHIQKVYTKNLNDEYVVPVSVNAKDNSIQDNDSVFFFNFREDRMRQIVESFINPSFGEFETKKFNNLFIASMTQVRGDFSIPVAFPPQKIESCLGRTLSENGKAQLRIAETQKYAHVTFFFNGLSDKPFPNEYRILIPSRSVPRQDQDPEMMAPAITTRLIGAMEERAFDFILVNYANPDMVAHTGNYEAAKKAIEIVDEQIGRVLQTALKLEHVTILITSDHGNVERMFNPSTGEPETKHDTSPVPIYLVGRNYYRPQNAATVQEREHFTAGMLADIAPTILEIFEIPKDPGKMSGTSLLPQLLS